MQSYPLTKANRLRLARAFAAVPRVDISIDALVEDQMGEAFVNNMENPTAFYVEAGGFFGYFAGEPDPAIAKAIKGGKLVMAGAPGWFDLLKEIHQERVTPIKRWTMDAASLSLDALPDVTPPLVIRRVKAEDLVGAPGYISIDDFDSPEDFVERSIGFVAKKDGKIVASCIGAGVCSDAVEVSIFVEDDYRRKGIATALGVELLKWCLPRHIEPHWDAANEESVGLAKKLGYTEGGTYEALYIKGEG